MARSPLSSDARRQIAERSLQRVLEWIKTVDTKGQISLGLSLALLGSIAALWPPKDQFTGATMILCIASGLLAVISATLTVLAFFPRLKSSKNPRISEINSQIFFGSIAEVGEDSFLEEFRNRTPEEYEEDLILQLHRNAVIVLAKYRLVSFAIGFQVAAIVPWMLLAWDRYSGTR